MILPVTIAGVDLAWRFRGSLELGEWLRGRPWGERNELQVVRVRSPLVEGVLAALRGGIRGADDARTGVRLHDLPPPLARAGGFMSAVFESLEIPPDLPRHAALRAAGERLLGPPSVLLLPPHNGPCPGLYGEANEWLDQVAKVSGVSVCVILVDTPDFPVAGTAIDLAVGLPADGALDPLGDGKAHGWRSYLHIRLAWEAAGDPAQALSWDQLLHPLPPRGADHVLEAFLNERSQEKFCEIGAAARSDVVGHLRGLLGGSVSRAVLERQASALERRDLLWRPPGEARSRLPPWLARGLLLTAAAPFAVGLLRASLVCVPLAREILIHCFDLEAQERSAGWAQSKGALPEKIRDRFARLQTGSGYSAGLYPASCPALPDEPWPLATFGEFLQALGRGHPRRRICESLLYLRNHVAHGNYVGWTAVRRLRQIEKQLLG